MSRTTQGEREPLSRPSRADRARQVRRVPPDRYQPGARRTSGQPLAASWRPEPDDDAPATETRKPKRPTGFHGVLATYGWRVYAVPVLVVITVLVLINTTGDDNGAKAGTAAPGTSAAGDQKSSDVAEVPVKPHDVNIPTAELPAGGNYEQAGTGEFAVLPGRGDRVGTSGELYTYTIEVEGGIDLTASGGDESFASVIDYVLAEPRGWAASGQVSVQRVDGDEEPDIRISLATPDTVHKPDNCGFSIQYESSCWRSDQSRVYINLARWIRGAVVFNGDTGSYRQYAINHEIGHAFDQGHVGCAEEGGLAPVMMQQSFGVANNYVAQLNDTAGNSDPVQADGKTCKPNPWPNPQAQPGG